MTECVVGVGTLRPDGYAVKWADGQLHRAHRLAWERAHGPIPQGMTIDHLCRNRACVNPDHLECVSLMENRSRGRHRNQFSGVTHCIHGHEFTLENTYFSKVGRECRECQRVKQRRRRARQKEMV